MRKIEKILIFLMLLSGCLEYLRFHGISFSMILGAFSASMIVIISIIFYKMRLNYISIISTLIIFSLTILFAFRYIKLQKVDEIELLKAYFSLFLNLSIIFVLNSMDFDKKYINYAISIYMKILIASSIIAIIQFIFSQFNIFLFAPWQKYRTLIPNVYRSVGIFGEPAHFGVFASIASLIPLNKLKFRFHQFLIIITGLLLTFSALSYFVLLLFIINYLRSYASFKQLAIIVLILLILFNIVIWQPQFQRVYKSVTSIIRKDYNSLVSTYQRIWMGFDIYKKLSLQEKILGIGIGEKEYLYSFLRGRIERFMNGLSEELSGLGILLFLVLNVYMFAMLGLKRFVLINVLKLGETITIFTPWVTYFYFMLSISLLFQRSLKNEKNKCFKST